MPIADDSPIGIVDPDAVIAAFGYWPSFHDAEVHRALLDRGGDGELPSITLVVHGIAGDGSVDEKGYYRIVTSVLVTLRCLDVSESELVGLGPQNVISSLDFEAESEGRVRMTLQPCYGLHGTIVCRQVRVEAVTPWRRPNDDAPPMSPQ